MFAARRSDHLLAPIPGLRCCLPKRRYRRAISRPQSALGSDVVEIAGPSDTSRIEGMVAVADRGVNRRFRGIIGTVARP